MKTLKILKTMALLGMLLISAGITAQQVQQEFINYQGVAYDSNDEALINETVDLRIALRFGGSNAIIEYAEDHTVTTNAAGVFNLQIGTGTVVAGAFNTLEWGTLAPYASIMVNGTTAGTVRLHSVPYANASGKAKNMELNDLTNVDGTPANGQVLKFNGTEWAPANDNGGSGNTYTAGDGINISGANEITAVLGTEITTNELQNNAVTTAKINNDAVTGSKIAAMGATNGQVLKYDGSDWVPANDENSGSGTIYTAGDGINISGTNEITAALGTSISNAEIETDAVTNVKIIDGAISTAKVQNNAITGDKIAAMAATNGQVLKYNGTDWVPANDENGGSGTTYTAGDGINISGTNEITAALGTSISTTEIDADAVTGDKIAPMAATNGQVLKYDGTNWVPANDETGGGGSTYTAGDGINISGTNEITAALGTSISNTEIDADAVTGDKIAPMGAIANQVLTYDGSTWNPDAIPAPTIAMNDLTDVNAGSPLVGEVLKWDGSVWTYGNDNEGTGPWNLDATTNEISYTTASVGIGISNPENSKVAHFGGDVFVQTNLGELQLGFPNNGNQWELATQGNGANLLFRSKPDGISSSTTQMHLTQDGKLGIGGSNTNPTARLHLFQNGQAVGTGLRFSDGTANDDWDITHGFALRFHYGGDLKGFINANTGAYTVTSDDSLKTNVEDLTSVTKRLLNLNPKTYSYISDKKQTKVIGFIAQEVKEIFPEFVHYSEADGLYGVDYAGLSVIAIKAIQEQNERLDTLEKRLEALEK